MSGKIRALFLYACILFSASFMLKQNNNLPPFSNEKSNHWADSVFATLTPDERIGQLFMVAAWSNKDKKHIKEIDTLIIKHKIGGLIFFQGGPVREAILTNKYQKESKVPLMISIDGEW